MYLSLCKLIFKVFFRRGREEGERERSREKREREKEN